MVRSARSRVSLFLRAMFSRVIFTRYAMFSLYVMYALFLTPSTGWAGACCIGSTSTVPIRLGECEKWLVGFGLSGETNLGWWGTSGTLEDSSLVDRGLIANLGGAWRWNRAGQVAVSVPLRLNQKYTDDLQDWGSGVGDVRISIMVSPFEESVSTGDGVGKPRLYFTLGTRLPTGLDLSESTSPLLADVTGLPGSSLIAGASVERATSRFPWSLGIDSEIPLGVQMPTLITASAGLGHYFGTKFSAMLSARRSFSFSHSSFSHGDEGWETASRTTVGIRLIRGQRLAWRVWAGAESDIPLDGFGHSNHLSASVSAGISLIR